MRKRWRLVALRGGNKTVISYYYLAKNARIAVAALNALRNGTTYLVEKVKP